MKRKVRVADVAGVWGGAVWTEWRRRGFYSNKDAGQVNLMKASEGDVKRVTTNMVLFSCVHSFT